MLFGGPEANKVLERDKEIRRDAAYGKAWFREQILQHHQMEGMDPVELSKLVGQMKKMGVTQLREMYYDLWYEKRGAHWR